ncbi:hypothetical protein NEUTE1DRAFT_54329 [Neurospora tetrasperma FGSC 2508]|uniref:Small secreted protein n=1 Tax=Neurospora tetrasperma (strain FGSC 2508 / ATCC MYA-4615 / P0657) TaxID=510951 RepID=F8N306_NEUT8|nr:uncharacterized protein NEUTE1DRAFT_54329 [Neurospora tetrasperma FGSC 2508]EGO52517.1 hypothetical protein NEUTE1DRAFT_54329 [Neurospora tetrasperma FGSC 2508]
MQFKLAFVFTLLTSALAAPCDVDTRGLSKRALSAQSYSQFQVSSGVGGNALAEVDENNLASVSAADLAIIKAARETAEDAETKAGGFNEAIKAAGGTKTTAGAALQVGKIKNKVLKLKLFTLAMQIEQAKGGKDNSAKIAEETKKLNNNIALDKAAAGQKSTSVNFQGTSQP